MPRVSILTISTTSPGRPRVEPVGASRPTHARRRPRTVLTLRLVEAISGTERPLADACVILTDERSVVVGGRTDASGRVSLHTGRAVVPIGQLEVRATRDDGRGWGGSVMASELKAMGADAAIHCNSLIRLA